MSWFYKQVHNKSILFRIIDKKHREEKVVSIENNFKIGGNLIFFLLKYSYFIMHMKTYNCFIFTRNSIALHGH